MAEGKKGFLLYADYQELFEELSDEDAGQLIKHIFKYVNDQSPKTDNKIVKISFIPIKRALKRDLKKYENICERNRLNGSKGGRPKNPKEPKKPNGLSGNPKEPKKADSDNDIDSERDINVLTAFKENVIETAKELSYPKSIFIPFLEHWTERDFESKCYAWQVPETFVIKSRLKGWKKNDSKNKVEHNDITKLLL